MMLNKYQEWTKTTVQYPPEVEEKYIAYGLASEIGELMGALAKYHRGDYDYDEYERRAKGEIGDIVWFLARYCDFSGWDLEDIVDSNYRKLEYRKKRGKIKGDGDDR